MLCISAVYSNISKIKYKSFLNVFLHISFSFKIPIPLKSLPETFSNSSSSMVSWTTATRIFSHISTEIMLIMFTKVLISNSEFSDLISREASAVFDLGDHSISPWCLGHFTSTFSYSLLLVLLPLPDLLTCPRAQSLDYFSFLFPFTPLLISSSVKLLNTVCTRITSKFVSSVQAKP